MTGLSLFSGIGGIDLAFEAAGGHVIAMCERDKFCQGILRRRWPDVPIYEDIKTLRGEEVGAVDIIFGGFPCQPFSVAGAQKSKNDDRYLWPEFSRLVGEIKPAWVVAENVSGILRLAADDVCEDLERQGYSVGIFHYEAAAVGAFHRRARVFFVAHTRRGVCEGSSIRRAFRGEHGEKTASDAERSDSSSPGVIPDAAGDRRSERAENGRRNDKRNESRTRNRFADVRATLPDTNCQRFQEQQSAFSTYRERASLEPVERGSGRSFEPILGRVADGLPCWLDRTWWQRKPDISRVAPRGVPNRVQLLKSLGNAVVPAQIYPIFKGIVEIWQTDRENSHD